MIYSIKEKIDLPKDLNRVLKTIKEGGYISKHIGVIWSFEDELHLKLMTPDGSLLKDYTVTLQVALPDVIRYIDFNKMAEEETIDFDRELLSIFHGEREQKLLY